MKSLGSIGALVLASLYATACSTPAIETATAQNAPAPPSYSEAVADLMAATRTHGGFQSTRMTEVQPCKFFFEISPGRQSTVGFVFDVRQLDVNALSASTGQASQSDFSRRIGCARDQGACASNTGMPVPFVDIAAPTAEDLDRAIAALRNVQAACRTTPPPAG